MVSLLLRLPVLRTLNTSFSPIALTLGRGTVHLPWGARREREEVRIIIESVDSISRDERDSPLTQYITNAGISRAGYTITHFNVFYG